MSDVVSTQEPGQLKQRAEQPKEPSQDEPRTDEAVYPGRFLDECQIDLPPDDVIEEIEFERFFRLNVRFGDLQGPVVINLQQRAVTSQKLNDAAAPQVPGAKDLESGKAEARATNSKPPVAQAVPLSTNPEDWALLAHGVPAGAALVPTGSPLQALATAGSDGGNALDIASLPLALYMPFTQQWKLEGYTRGRLVNSFSLGPGEEQTVEIFTWDRTRSSLESSTSFESEQTAESSGSRRDTADVSRDVSRQAGFELTTGGKVGFQVGVINADLSAGMSARTGVNDAEKTTRSSIVEATSRSTNHVRTHRTLKVTESRESGREERVTRRLRNPNVCHALTVPFFEILTNYWVSTFVRAPEVRLVVLIKSSQLSRLLGFDRKAVRTHESALRLALLDRTLQPGFDAARLLDARDRACAILCKGCSCGEGSSGAVTSKEWDAVVAAARSVASKVDTLRSQLIRFPGSIPDAVVALPSGTDDIKRYLFRKTLAAHAPRLIIDLAAAGISGGGAQVSVSQVEAVARVVGSVPPEALALLRYDDDVSTAVYWEIYAFVVAAITHDPVSGFVVANVVKGNAGALKTYDDAGLLDALSAFSVAYEAWSKVQQEERLKNEKLAELARIAKEERELRILESFGLKETAEAEERLQALLDHLNDSRNIDHYRFAVWNERAGGADDTITSLALAGWIDPIPVGIVGDQLAVPVRFEGNARLAAFFANSVKDLIEHTTVDEKRHILPSSALYVEAIVGDCCACEHELVERRHLETERMRRENELLVLEGKRLDARLHAVPPQLDKDPPAPARLEVVVHQAGQGAPAGASSSRSIDDSSGGTPMEGAVPDRGQE